MDREIELSHKSEVGRIHRVQAPRLGLGVFQIPCNEIGCRAIKHAIEVGYRHIDTASIYENEKIVGQAIRESGIERSKFFITTKLWANEGIHDYMKSCKESLKRLELQYVDLYLVHSPPKPENREKVWMAMESLLENGYTRSIGVSNYGIHHLKELFDYANIRPSTNQIELSPYIQRKDLVEFCKRNDIVLTAYSPLTRGLKIDDPKLSVIADKYGKTPAQILIRWGLQSDFIVIPKSIRHDRINENFSVYDFKIEEDDFNKMLEWDENFNTCWDPTANE